MGSSSGTVHIFDVCAGLRKRQQASGGEEHRDRDRDGGNSSNGSSSGNNGGDNGGSDGGEEGGAWHESLATSAMTYLSMAQSWGKATVGGMSSYSCY